MASVCYNLTEEDITLKAGQTFGKFTLTPPDEGLHGLAHSWMEGEILAMGKPDEAKGTNADNFADILKRTSQTVGPEPQHVWPEEKKRRWLRDQFGLIQNPMLPTAAAKKKAEDLLIKYFQLFTFNKSSGSTHLIEHEILTGNAKPFCCKH